MTDRILIAGGAGCLGSNLIEHLLPKGAEIAVIDNFATGHRELVQDIPNVCLFEGSIADKRLVDDIFDEFAPRKVINSAASYKDPDDWLEDTRTNVEGTINLVMAAKRTGVARFINFQTALCYGRAKQIPIAETARSEPFTSYGISKTAGEYYLENAGISYVSLRLANITGPRLAIGPIPTFYKRLKEGKPCFCSDAVRDFLDMADFLSLMDIVLEEDSPTGTYNISTGEGRSIKDIFDHVVEYLGVELEQEVPVVPVGEDDVQKVVLDPSKARAELGWQANISFQEMMTKMLDWYDAFGINAIHSHLKAPASTR